MNQTHKTSVLDTVALGLTGKHRIGPYPSDLAELMPDGAEQLFVELTNPSGDGVSWRMPAPGGKAKRPDVPKGTGEYAAAAALGRFDNALVMRGIGDLLDYGKDRMREALMVRFGAATDIPTPTGLNAEQRAVWAEIAAGTTGNPSERLAAMAKAFRSESRKLGGAADAKAAWIASHSVAAGDDIAGVELLPQYEAQLQQARAWALAQPLRAKLDGRAPDVVRLELDALRKTQAELQAQNELLVGLQHAAEHAAGNCVLCGQSADMTIALTKLRARSSEYTRDLAETRARIVALEDVHNAAVRLAQLSAPTSYQGPDAFVLQNEVNRLREAEGARKQLDATRREMYQLQQRSDVCKVLEREAAKLLKRLLHDVAGAAEAAVNRYMPDEYVARLVVSDKAVEWRVVGTDQRPHKQGGMCGREEGALMVALACAWTEGAPFRMLMLDDRELGVFDANNLLDLMGRLYAAQQRGDLDQVIIAWNRPHEIPSDLDGWTVINRE